MSDEANIAAVTRFTDALERGDLDAAETELGPKVEIDDTDIPDSDNRDSFRQWIGRWNEVFDSWRIEDLEVRPAGEDRVLSLFTMVATGRGSGVELNRGDATLSTLCDGKIVKIGYYNDQGQAIEAVGSDR